MVIVVFGVAGAGKTTVGRMLASDVGWKFLDADDIHPPANIEKMTSGIPLNDRDREGWLESLSGTIRESLTRAESVVLACSALKAAYRKKLAVSDDVIFVYLKAEPQLAAERLAQRSGHFMNPSLLASQYEALETPGEDTLTIDTSLTPEDIVNTIKLRILT